ncbi:hypothetical protein S2M10_29540 [Sphingomonas sp. S2M10]|uniref:hypothetical protein n=1 Tax=Sphingomonas sp. S2M10 TaxID=2705010 RepID=UPI001456BD23|nr:hypothetical protein [Sphingomonas sp. S2M10]NLS27952.1 hypothetical protein [Sphingomonas sp. S2M10]
MNGGNLESVAASAARAAPAPDLRSHDTPGDLFDEPALPKPCPVTPLGIHGLKLWVLDSSNQLQCITTDCRKGEMLLLFGGDTYLRDSFPRFSPPKRDKPPEIVGWDQTEAQTALIRECHARGIFDPQGRIFGRGAHRVGDDEEALVLHMGREVLAVNTTDKKGKLVAEPKAHPAGPIGDRFFPALPPLPQPAKKASTKADADLLLDLFRQWNFKEAGVAPLLLLGMSGQMHICGALSWRSHMWLSAPTAAGKSSLQRLFRAIHGGWCLHTEDASEAAIRQKLGDDTLPVLIDEAEADDNPERQRAILNLLKKSSSGAKMHRGSADHKAQEFTAQSCFMLSSVLHGLQKGEEWNRVAIIELMPVEKSATMWEEPDYQQWRMIGRKMHRRMIEQWPRFRRTLTDYKREIHERGLGGRWQDTFGTLLACADCLLFDCAPSMESHANPEFGRERAWVDMIMPMMRRGQIQARSDIDRCLSWLISKMLPGAHGQPAEPIGRWIDRAMEIVINEQDGPTGGLNTTARKRLESWGLRLLKLKENGRGGWVQDGEPLPDASGWEQGWLVVAYPSWEPLRELFRGSEWASGAWIQSLGKIEGAITSGLKVRFGGPAQNAIAIPLRAVKGEG